MTTSNTFYFDRARNGYTFRRMNRTEWYETSHLIRRFHITNGMLMGSIYEEQFFMVYSGYEGYGVEVEPLHSRAGGLHRELPPPLPAGKHRRREAVPAGKCTQLV